MPAAYPVSRPRRLRQNAAMRALVAQTTVTPANLVLPIFVREGITEPAPIDAMPGVVQHTLDSLRKAATQAVEAGVGGLMLFGVPATRDATGSGADDPNGICNQGLQALKKEVGDATVIMADLCLDEFTDHGHCGVLAQDGTVDNDATLERYRSMALSQADAGATILGPSGMMDGQVRAIRDALDKSGHTDVAILAYSAKYASALYGPFREAVDSQLLGDRRAYQQDYTASPAEAAHEVSQDIEEGADMVMIKPASYYLDILAQTKAQVDVPVAAYQVSGEYSMICAAAQNGWIDKNRAIHESLTAIKRAGADIILTYWAAQAAAAINAGDPTLTTLGSGK